jgi:hypothetical protein
MIKGILDDQINMVSVSNVPALTSLTFGFIITSESIACLIDKAVHVETIDIDTVREASNSSCWRSQQ